MWMDDIRRNQGLLFIISGPSGVGKDTVLQALRPQLPAMHFVVTATTRPQGPGEIEGYHYYFVNQETFQRMLNNNDLLEHALVHHKYYYGVPRSRVREALASGQDAIMRIDVQGAATIRNLAPAAVTIFLIPSCMDELRQRLDKRQREGQGDIASRLKTAEEEMARSGEFEYTVLNRNDGLPDAVADIMSIIRAEHCRTKRRSVVI
jgi:guanylate kinase